MCDATAPSPPMADADPVESARHARDVERRAVAGLRKDGTADELRAMVVEELRGDVRPRRPGRAARCAASRGAGG